MVNGLRSDFKRSLPRRTLDAVRWQLRPWARWTLRRRVQRPDSFWLFLAGVNHSGATLLHRLLAEHPEIRALPADGSQLSKAIPAEASGDRLWTQRFDRFRWFADENPRRAERAAYDWAGYYGHHGRILLEKSPANCLRTLWLQQHFQPARFLIVTRHPYAACASLCQSNGCAIDQAATHWTLAYQTLLEDASQLEQAMTVSYEQLTRSTVETLGKIEQFLGLRKGFDPDADFAGKKGETGSGPGQADPLRNLNDHMVEKLSVEQRAEIHSIAGALMQRLRYVVVWEGKDGVSSE